jgi:hypothetical protein
MRPADHGRLDRNGTELSELRSQAPRARLLEFPNDIAEPDSKAIQIGAPGRTRTGTEVCRLNRHARRQRTGQGAP